MVNYLEQLPGFRNIIFFTGIIFVTYFISFGGAIAADFNAVTDGHRHYDARISFNQGLSQSFTQPQKQQIAKMLKKIPGAVYAIDNTTGGMRSLSSHTGFLSGPKSGLKPSSAAKDFLKSNVALLGMKSQDLSSYKITDEVYSKVSGITHIYMRQTHQGLPVYNDQIQVNVSRNQRVISVNNAAVSNLASSVNAVKPTIDIATAVTKAAQQLSISLSNSPKILKQASGAQQISTVEKSGISLETIQGRLMWLPIRKGMLRLVWNFQVYTLDQQHAYDYTVDAESGKIWTRFDWIASDQYRVYAMPAESPNHTTPLPPGDGRKLVSNPANSNASPFKWHDTNGTTGAEFTSTRGNNVHAYADVNADNSPDAGSSPSGGSSLNFDFPINLNRPPSSYSDAAVTNLFYWNNIIHDVQYQYGFDEAAGNFQTNNYDKGGLGGDAVRAEARDGSGTNNANFLTPNDGSAPRMQMFLWDRTSPERDGDLDNGIIIHEYGHGISTRLVGGPSNVNCLTNRQQPGEGLSDWWSLAYTAKTGDSGSDPRGIGTYAFGQPVTGSGIRTQRYSTDPAVNTWTYESINGMRVPHGVGSVWAQAAWEVYWALVDHWGFDPNLYNAQGSAGNQRMMLYVNEGLKNTACNPTFTQVRDGIIDAAKVIHGGEDVCRIWTAFAAFGLGTDAVSGGSDSTSPTNGFAVPATCQTIDPTPPTTAVYDSSLKAPKCSSVGNSCTSENLLRGRDGKGAEPNQPNTISNSCGDGTSGDFHDDESIDRLGVSTLDGSNFAAGKPVRIDIKIWAWSSPSQDHLDLYYAADANNPNWIFIQSITPTESGEQTLSETYTLPQGKLQAVRANFRYQQSRSSCSSGNYDDHDDLIFAVNSDDEPDPNPDPEPGSTVFSDDFETDKGWRVNPFDTDTAIRGQWERGNPEATSSNGPKQLGTTVSGVNDLVTGRLAGTSVGSHDIDRGITSIQSPIINLPSTGNINLSFHYYFAYVNSSSDDLFRVKVVGNTTSTVFEKRASSDNVDGSWTPVSVSLNAFAGQAIRILIEAADLGRGSIVEAGIDDIKVIKN